MDYLRELRLRQQAVLNRLLTGDHSGEETIAVEEVPAGQKEDTLRPAAERARKNAQTESREILASTGQRIRDGEKEADRQSTELAVQATEFQQTRRADAFWRSETFSAERLPGLLLMEQSGTAISAEDISWAGQRDARRYDGGFTMF